MTISRIPEWPVLFEWRKVMIIVVNVHIFKTSADLFCKPSFFFFLGLNKLRLNLGV